MIRLYQFANERPVLFDLLVLLLWLISTGLIAGLASFLIRVPIISPLSQSIGALTATAILMVIFWRFGWLRPAGIANLGSGRGWLATLATLIYLLMVYSYAFFGEISFDLTIFSQSEAARSILWRQIVVGLVEEILFRGVLLYGLVRVWGESRRGLMASLLFVSFLFGVLHLLQVGGGNSLGSALAVALESFISGIWWGAIVLLWTSVWPAVVLHAASNSAVLIKALASPGLMLSDSSFVLAAMFELPLALLFLWILWRSFPLPRLPETPHLTVET